MLQKKTLLSEDTSIYLMAFETCQDIQLNMRISKQL